MPHNSEWTEENTMKKVETIEMIEFDSNSRTADDQD
jgi:hypothetical protein